MVQYLAVCNLTKTDMLLPKKERVAVFFDDTESVWCAEEK